MEISQQIWQEGFKVTDDLTANILVRHYNSAIAEKNKQVENIQNEITYLSDMGSEIERKFEIQERAILRLLEDYMKQLEEEDKHSTATQEKYKLNRCELIIKKSVNKIVTPSKDITSILETMYPDYVKTTTSLNWGDFKKTLEISEDVVVVEKATGKVIKELLIEQESEVFQVKFK